MVKEIMGLGGGSIGKCCVLLNHIVLEMHVDDIWLWNCLVSADQNIIVENTHLAGIKRLI